MVVVLGFCSSGTLWKPSLGMLSHLLIRWKQELREGGRGSCSPAKNLKARSSMYGNFSAFLIFSGNSCSLLAPVGKCWQLKGGWSFLLGPSEPVYPVSHIFLTIPLPHLSVPAPPFWLECLEGMVLRSPQGIRCFHSGKLGTTEHLHSHLGFQVVSGSLGRGQRQLEAEGGVASPWHVACHSGWVVLSFGPL